MNLFVHFERQNFRRSPVLLYPAVGPKRIGHRERRLSCNSLGIQQWLIIRGILLLVLQSPWAIKVGLDQHSSRVRYKCCWWWYPTNYCVSQVPFLLLMKYGGHVVTSKHACSLWSLWVTMNHENILLEICWHIALVLVDNPTVKICMTFPTITFHSINYQQPWILRLLRSQGWWPSLLNGQINRPINGYNFY